jgi:endonuclease/exonuclease/phosphatase family metal-dependent hydrolase
MKELRVITANVDFALKSEAVGKDLELLIRQGEVILFQEAKSVNIDRLIKDPEWEVIQFLDSPAQKGSGIAYKKARIRHKAARIRLGVEPRRQKMLARYLVSATLFVKDETGDEHPLVVASVHLPPKRYSVLYPAYVASIVAFATARRRPVLIGGDWNKHSNDRVLKRLAKRIGATLHFHGIDGFFLVAKKTWKFKFLKDLGNTRSDHNPILISITLKEEDIWRGPGTRG